VRTPANAIVHVRYSTTGGHGELLDRSEFTRQHDGHTRTRIPQSPDRVLNAPTASIPSRTTETIRVALVNDYEIVLEGLRALLRPYDLACPAGLSIPNARGDTPTEAGGVGPLSPA
jgi:hypothetical protein